jgi:peptidyl-prolyl cis-trans isomerase-like 4
VDQLDGMTEEEIDKYMKDREARTRAKLLEIIGDIPDADVKPPENVLFVCKLNPVTTDEDLELIFSRFGKINSCEVIRDKKTGDSLCYAFIDFDREEDCENAYFKMDNVLIDDRRIHVDFSQSVSKVQWKGKGTGTGYGLNYQNKSNKNDDEKSERPQYRVNDKSRKEHGYDLVFEDGEEGGNTGRKYEPIRKEYTHKSNNDESYKKNSGAQRNNDKHYDDRYEKRDRDSHRHRDEHSSDKRREYKDRDRDRDRDYEEKDKNREHRSTHQDKDRHHHRNSGDDRSSSNKSNRAEDRDKKSSSSRRH